MKASRPDVAGEDTGAAPGASPARGALDVRRLARDSAWNLVGHGAPMVAALFSIPPTIRLLGEERFGVLALAWMLIGYFTFLDLGLGRALTQVIASRLGRDEAHELPGYVGTALVVLLALGALGGAAVFALAPWLAGTVLEVPPHLHGETVAAFRLMGASLPCVTLTSALRGVVEARRWFARLGLVRVPLGLATYVAPWAAAAFDARLQPVMAGLLAVRVAGLLGHAWLARGALAGIRVRWAPSRAALRSLARLGGWMTLTNVVGPLMVSLDRLVIGSMVSLAAVSFYATPYEIVTKLLVVPAALSGALFPAFSAAATLEDRRPLAALYRRASGLLLAALGPVVLAAIIGAHGLISAWISPEFAVHSAPVLQILAVGVLINAVAAVPFALVQGLGRPERTALLHLLELPLYLIVLWAFIRADGIRGAAVAWTLRVALDAAALHLLGRAALREKP